MGRQLSPAYRQPPERRAKSTVTSWQQISARIRSEYDCAACQPVVYPSCQPCNSPASLPVHSSSTPLAMEPDCRVFNAASLRCLVPTMVNEGCLSECFPLMFVFSSVSRAMLLRFCLDIPYFV